MVALLCTGRRETGGSVSCSHTVAGALAMGLQEPSTSR